MVSEQPTRTIVREFRQAGWLPGHKVGSHTKWNCPSGQHHYDLPDGHRTISPGVVRTSRAALTNCQCKKED